MKIGLLVNSAPPFPVAGAERQALEMAKRLASRHEVTVFARRFGGAPITETIDGYRLVRCPFMDFGPLRFPSQTLSFLRLFKKHGRDLDVILCYQTFIPGYLAAQAKQRFGVPFVLWIRSQDEFQYTTRKKFGWAGKTVLPQADHVLVQSTGVRKQFLDEARRAYGGDLAARLDAVTTIGRNAVDLPGDGASSTEAHGSGSAPGSARPGTGTPRSTEILFVGRLIALKDLSTLFRALRRMDAPPPVRIVGDGPMRVAWEAEAAGLPVTFAGRVEPEVIAAEYQRAKVFVLMSLEEGMPNVVLEALAAGVPVISTPVAAVPDVITEGVNGFLFPFGDDVVLAERLTRVLGDEALHAELSRGAMETAKEYSWEAVMGEVEGVLEKVGDGRQKGRTPHSWL